MTIDPSMSVGTLAAMMPFMVRLLEDEGIDYHLGGAQSLRDACAQAHANLERVLGHIQLAMARPREVNADWTVAPLEELIAHVLEGHHDFTKSLCRRVRGDLAVALATHRGSKTLQRLSEVFDSFEDDLLTHLDREEMFVFPYISALARHERKKGSFNSVEYPIRIINFEHETQEEWLKNLRALSDGYSPPPRACAALRAVHADLASLERDLHEHLHLENNVLFPRAVELEREYR